MADRRAGTQGCEPVTLEGPSGRRCRSLLVFYTGQGTTVTLFGPLSEVAVPSTSGDHVPAPTDPTPASSFLRVFDLLFSFSYHNSYQRGFDSCFGVIAVTERPLESTRRFIKRS